MSLYVEKNYYVISQDLRKEISNRYRRITRAINREFWGSESDIANTLYVGSYGRGTAIEGSDLDILASLPESEYERYDAYRGNGQSRLLQTVKDALKTTYPTTDIHADGQIVKIHFSDCMKFEILPAFKNWDGTYRYPDSNTGGKWLPTNPKSEQFAISSKNKESNGLLIDTCQSIRHLRDEGLRSYPLSGIVIDSVIYAIINDWHWLQPGEARNSNGISYRDYLLQSLRSLLNSGEIFHIASLGTNMSIPIEKSLKGLTSLLNFI